MQLPPESDRLRFRPARLSDARFFCQLMNQPDYLRFIGDRQITDISVAEAMIADRFLSAYAIGDGFGVLLVERICDGETLGFLSLFNREAFAHPDLGYAFLNQHQGQGYAREAAAAYLSFIENTLGLKALCAIVTPGNSRSLQLLDKLGFSWSRRMLFPGTDNQIELLEWTSAAGHALVE